MGVSAAFAIIGTGVSIHAAGEQKKATKQQVQAQKTQQREQKKLSDIKAQRERRKVVQAQLKAQSDILVASGEQGADSRTAGVAGSVATKGASALLFAGQSEQIAGSIFEAGLVATAASANVATAQSVGQIGGSLTSFSSTLQKPSVTSTLQKPSVKSIFD